MFFIIKNNRYQSVEQLRTSTLISAYFIIQNYKLRATDLPMEHYIQQQYKMSLKDMCIKLLLSLTLHKDDAGNLVLLFNNQKHDAIARLISYGNGAIPGSKILKTALKI